MNWLVPARNLFAGALICAVLASSSATAVSLGQPLQFFLGRTEMISTVKVFARRPYQSRTLGTGRILPDGSLALIQQVFEEGKSEKRRNWKIRQLAPGRYGGTMSDAVGPVVVEEVDGRYRFVFRMKGNLSVEQWLTPVAGGDAAKSNLTVRKFGFRVASSVGVVRRL
ncbi:MAG TPA: hypothetical protein VGM04_03420 [Sphingomicrobium sp.]